MADEGLVAPLSKYVQVYLNGQFYGLYGMIEEVRLVYKCHVGRLMHCGNVPVQVGEAHRLRMQER